MSSWSITYRFLHELEASRKVLHIAASSIRAEQLKLSIAKVHGLETEINRIFDFKLYSQGADKTLREIVDNNEFIVADSSIVVQRYPCRQQKRIEHTINEEVSDCKYSSGTLPFPEEYLCRLCRSILTSPVLVRCASRCNLTACRACVNNALKSAKRCPFCASETFNIVPNKSISAILSKLNLRDFKIRRAPHENLPEAQDSKVETQIAQDVNSLQYQSNSSCQDAPIIEKSESFFSMQFDDAGMLSPHYEQEATENSKTGHSAPFLLTAGNLLTERDKDIFSRCERSRYGGSNINKARFITVQTDSLNTIQPRESSASGVTEPELAVTETVSSNTVLQRTSDHELTEAKLLTPLQEPKRLNHSPSKSTTDIVSLFPLISHKDFYLIRLTQAQLKWMSGKSNHEGADVSHALFANKFS